MAVEDLSPSAQDYLKAIWDLQEWESDPVLPSAVAEKTGMRPSTVSGALTRLVEAGLVAHKPYGGIALTEEGRRSAVTMVRRHRLLETFLVRVLDYGWDEVHAEADALEHCVSDKMIARIDDILGHPSVDPHGDLIPGSDGALPDHRPTIALSQAGEGSLVRIERVSDEDSDMLRYLQDRGVVPGACFLVGGGSPYTQTLTITAYEAGRPRHAVRGAVQGEGPSPRDGEGGAGDGSPRQVRSLTLGDSAAELIRVSLVGPIGEE